MKNKSQADYEIAEDKANIKISREIKTLHPVVVNIANNLADIDLIKFIRISPDYLKASNETTNGRVKIPITKPDHPTAIGVWLILDLAYKDIQFYEINSAIKGYGGKMVDAVMKALPKDWNAVIVMDWSHGFWDKMKERYKNLVIL
jgi:hypothetical protein